jgi:hypothetical protein
MLSLSEEMEPQTSMFTTSGNSFIFDHLHDNNDATAAAAADDNNAGDSNNKSPSEEASAPTPTTKPASASAERKDKPDVAAFINSFRQEGRAMPSSILNLKAMLLAFPELVYLERLDSGDTEVLFQRDQLIKTLRSEEERFPQLVFTSFERGLKHAGMEVTQSTHGQITIKRWGMKKGFVAKPAGAKRVRKRKDTGDDDYDDSKKQRRALSASSSDFKTL